MSGNGHGRGRGLSRVGRVDAAVCWFYTDCSATINSFKIKLSFGSIKVFVNILSTILTKVAASKLLTISVTCGDKIANEDIGNRLP